MGDLQSLSGEIERQVADLRREGERLGAWIRAFGHLQAAVAPALIVDCSNPERMAEQAVALYQHQADEAEQYRMRLAGCLIIAEGGDAGFRQSETAAPYLRTCPTIAAVARLAEQAARLDASLVTALRENLRLDAEASAARASQTEALTLGVGAQEEARRLAGILRPLLEVDDPWSSGNVAAARKVLAEYDAVTRAGSGPATTPKPN